MAASSDGGHNTMFPVGTKVEVLSYDEGFEWSRSEAVIAVRGRGEPL